MALLEFWTVTTAQNKIKYHCYDRHHDLVDPCVLSLFKLCTYISPCYITCLIFFFIMNILCKRNLNYRCNSWSKWYSIASSQCPSTGYCPGDYAGDRCIHILYSRATHHHIYRKDGLEDTKGAIRSSTSMKHRQYNDQNQNEKWSTKHYAENCRLEPHEPH